MFARYFSDPTDLSRSAQKLVKSLAIDFNKWRGRKIRAARRKPAVYRGFERLQSQLLFCAYPKKSGPKVAMKDDLFRNTVRQALDLGFY